MSYLNKEDYLGQLCNTIRKEIPGSSDIPQRELSEEEKVFIQEVNDRFNGYYREEAREKELLEIEGKDLPEKEKEDVIEIIKKIRREVIEEWRKSGKLTKDFI